MAGQINGPEDYLRLYHNEKGKIICSKEGVPIEKSKGIKELKHFCTKTPKELWDQRITRHKAHDTNNSPNDNATPNPDLLHITQAALDKIAKKFTDPSLPTETVNWFHKICQNILDNPGDNLEPLEADQIQHLNHQLNQKEIMVKSKDQEIENLKAQLDQQQKEIGEQESKSQAQQKFMKEQMEQMWEIQKDELKDQMRKVQEQREKETIQFCQQIQVVKDAFEKQKVNMGTYPWDKYPPHSENSGLVAEFAKHMDTQNYVIKQQQLSSAPSFDGSDPKKFAAWIEDINRLSIQLDLPKMDVAQTTSRGPVHKYVLELRKQHKEWKDFESNLRERFSDCTSSAAAQSKLASLKQNGRRMHEYIEEFSELLAQAYNKKPHDFGTEMLVGSFIEGIDEVNRHTRFKLRIFTGAQNLDEYFQYAMKLEKGQEVRAFDYGTTQEVNTFEVNAVRSKTLTCFNCGSSEHLVRECPEPNKQQSQNPSYSHNRQWTGNNRQWTGNNRQYTSNPSHSNNSNPFASIEQALAGLTQAIQSFKGPSDQSYNKPKQSYQHNRYNPQAKPNPSNQNNRPNFRSNYQKQHAQINALEDNGPQLESDYCPDQEDLIALDPCQDQQGNL